jgi:hypothetical protein
MPISDIQLKGSFYNVFDGSKKIKDLHQPTVGELCGFSSDIIVFEKGSYFSVYDESGKRLKELHGATVGDFRSVSGSNILFKKGSYIDTYDLSGKKTNSRHNP